MKAYARHERGDGLVNELVGVWEASVRATHDFLTEADITRIKPQVGEGIRAISALVCARDTDGRLCGFMGVEHGKIEMLFVHPACRGTGLGRTFIEHAVERLGASLVDVNEQNAQGVGFYEHLGFRQIGRSPLDETGQPFPILHLKK